MVMVYAPITLQFALSPKINKRKRLQSGINLRLVSGGDLAKMTKRCRRDYENFC